jgi:hypothetical protein
MNLRFESPFEPQQQSPTRQRGITAHDPISNQFTLKTGLGGTPIFFVDSIGVSSQVAPGGTATVEVGVTNAATRISGSDPDVCRDGINDGFKYRATIEPEWTQSEERVVCLGSGMASPDIQSWSFTVPQQSGSYEVDVTVENAVSGGGGTLTKTVTVPQQDNDNGGNNGGDDGDDDVSLDPGVGDDDRSTGNNGSDFDFDDLIPDGQVGLTVGAFGLVVLLFLILLLVVAAGG